MQHHLKLNSNPQYATQTNNHQPRFKNLLQRTSHRSIQLHQAHQNQTIQTHALEKGAYQKHHKRRKTRICKPTPNAAANPISSPAQPFPGSDVSLTDRDRLRVCRQRYGNTKLMCMKLRRNCFWRISSWDFEGVELWNSINLLRNSISWI